MDALKTAIFRTFLKPFAGKKLVNIYFGAVTGIFQAFFTVFAPVQAEKSCSMVNIFEILCRRIFYKTKLR